MKRSKSDYRIQTVANSMNLLEQFADEEELGVTELSRRLELHKNNVFRILATLEERHYVEQCPGSDRYRLGVRCLHLGLAVGRTRNLTRLGRTAVEALARETGECAHLATLRNGEVVHLDGEEPDQLVGTVLRVGRRLDPHCTALGKALLAFAEPAILERFDRERIREHGLPAPTGATITDREKLFEHLHMVASRGYALDEEECADGLCCAAAPVYDGRGVVVAALSVSGPSFRLAPEVLAERVVPRVVAAAEELSRQLGYSGA